MLTSVEKLNCWSVVMPGELHGMAVESLYGTTQWRTRAADEDELNETCCCENSPPAAKIARSFLSGMSLSPAKATAQFVRTSVFEPVWAYVLMIRSFIVAHALSSYTVYPCVRHTLMVASSARRIGIGNTAGAATELVLGKHLPLTQPPQEI